MSSQSLLPAVKSGVTRLINYSSNGSSAPNVSQPSSIINLGSAGNFSGKINSAWRGVSQSFSGVGDLTLYLSGAVGENIALRAQGWTDGSAMPKLTIDAGNSTRGNPTDCFFADLSSVNSSLTFTLADVSGASAGTVATVARNGAPPQWTLKNFEYFELKLGSGNDVGKLLGSANVVVDGGAGNDVFYTNTLTRAEIDGGSGRDTLSADLRKAVSGAVLRVLQPVDDETLISLRCGTGSVTATDIENLKVLFGRYDDRATIQDGGRLKCLVNLDGGGGTDSLDLRNIYYSSGRSEFQSNYLRLNNNIVTGKIGTVLFSNFETIKASFRDADLNSSYNEFYVDARILDINNPVKINIDITYLSTNWYSPMGALCVDYSNVPIAPGQVTNIGSEANVATQPLTIGTGTFTGFSNVHFIGTAGDDIIFGLPGTAFRTSFDGILPGDDFLEGRAGNDILDGRGGSDQLIGGLGADQFYIYKANQFDATYVGDFNASEGDKLCLFAGDFTGIFDENGIAESSFIATDTLNDLDLDNRTSKLVFDKSSGDLYFLGAGSNEYLSFVANIHASIDSVAQIKASDFRVI